MLVATMIAVLLPLAASCPCSDQDPAAEVCGSDQRTYRSQCDLRCTAPGLSLLHAGPCSPMSSDTPARLEHDNAAQLTGGLGNQRPRRSATDQRREWAECERDRCHNATGCGCRPGDDSCAHMCRWGCECGCGGYPPGGTDYGPWRACYDGERQCGDKYLACDAGCWGRRECEDACHLDYSRCHCECVQRAHAATEQRRKWAQCEAERQCGSATCGECGGDRSCASMCRWNCECSCAGYPGGGADWGLFQKCFARRGCSRTQTACASACGSQGCKDACYLAFKKCDCECMLEAGNSTTNSARTTKAAGTTSTLRTTPTTSTTSTTSTPRSILTTSTLRTTSIPRTTITTSIPSTTLTISTPHTTGTPRTSSATNTTSTPRTTNTPITRLLHKTPAAAATRAPACAGWGCALVVLLVCAGAGAGVSACVWARARTRAVSYYPRLDTSMTALHRVPGSPETHLEAEEASDHRRRSHGDVELASVDEPPP